MINLKTEIIYFKCTTDFEFEFNLNTAVQIRLFTECPADDKAFLGALSLAVSRSRTIIITSNFNEELITKLAGAIGFKTETIIPSEYGITEMNTDKLITGGVPLVTNDGVYAGIILESGPQSLIIITNERATRKKLMNELVHSYLNDVAFTVENNTPVVKKTISDVVEDNISDDISSDVLEDVTVDTNTDDNEVEVTTTETVDEVIDDAVIDGDDITEEPVIYGLNDDIDTAEGMPAPKQKRNTGIFTAILAVILFLLVAFIVYSLIIDPFLNNVSIEENFKHIFGFLFG